MSTMQMAMKIALTRTMPNLVMSHCERSAPPRFADQILSSVACPVSIRAVTLERAVSRAAIVAKAAACFYKAVARRR